VFTLIPSSGARFVGSLLITITITIAAAWYIWRYCRRMFWNLLAPPPNGKNIIHMPSASGRELVVIRAQSPGYGAVARCVP